jgi:hypothetical protein
MKCENSKVLSDDLTFDSINSTNFLLSEEKKVKEFTTGIIMHQVKKNRNDFLKTARKLNFVKSSLYNLIQSPENLN